MLLVKLPFQKQPILIFPQDDMCYLKLMHSHAMDSTCTLQVSLACTYMWLHATSLVNLCYL